MTWAAFSAEPGILIVILLSIAGALAALAQAAVRTVYRVYPLDPIPNTYWDATIALALGIVGLVVQFAVTAKGKK
jgi:hypothetical protein